MSISLRSFSPPEISLLPSPPPLRRNLRSSGDAFLRNQTEEMRRISVSPLRKA